MSPVLLLLIATLSPELEPPAPGEGTPFVNERVFLEAAPGPDTMLELPQKIRVRFEDRHTHITSRFTSVFGVRGI